MKEYDEKIRCGMCSWFEYNQRAQFICHLKMLSEPRQYLSCPKWEAATDAQKEAGYFCMECDCWHLEWTGENK